MSRRSTFEQDFRDLHGEEIETFEAAPGSYRVHSLPRSAPPLQGFRIFPRRRVPNAGFRLVAGALGLFWSLVLGAALVAMLALAGIFGWALISTLNQSIPS